MQLRERDLWPHGAGQIQRVELGGVVLTREGDRWMIKAEGIAARADPAAATRLLSAVAGLRAARFVSSPDCPPRASILVDGSGYRLQLRHGAACPGRPTETLAVQEGQPRRSLCLAREDLAGLQREARELIDPVVTHLGESDAQEVHLTGASGGITLIRDGGYWNDHSLIFARMTSSSGPGFCGLARRGLRWSWPRHNGSRNSARAPV